MRVVIDKLTTVVLKQIEMGWIVTCGKCRGLGVEPTYSARNCTSCGGTGHRKLLLPDDTYPSPGWGPVFCGHCQGAGIEPTYQEKSCICCDGRGVQAGAFPRVKCGSCSGSGIEPTYNEKVCTSEGCDGTGTIYVDHLR